MCSTEGGSLRTAGIELWVVVLYRAGVVAVGSWVGRKTRSTAGFMAAGRSVPGWVVGLSIFGTYLSSISFLALPSKAFAGNWNAFVFNLAIPVTAWVAVRHFVLFFVQSTVSIIGALACMVVLALGMPEGPGQLLRVAVAHDKFSLGSFLGTRGDQVSWRLQDLRPVHAFFRGGLFARRAA